MSRQRPFPEDHEKPWTEEEWLDDMKRNDARADRFGELLETFMDHPERDELVAREMGWTELADDLKKANEQDHLSDPPAFADAADEDGPEEDVPAWLGEEDDSDFPDPDDEDEPEDVRGETRDEPDDDEEERDECDDKMDRDEPARRIPEFKFANKLGMKIHRILDPYGKGQEDPTDGLLSEACGGAWIASAKIVGGHSLGYDEHYINGNIARQRIGLEAVDKSIRAFEQLKKDKHLPAKLVDSILPPLNELRGMLADRIERLRGRARRLHGEVDRR